MVDRIMDDTLILITFIALVVVSFIILVYMWCKVKRWCTKYEQQKFDGFIRDKVISTFNNQLQGGGYDDQFAVLMLASTTSLCQLSKMNFQREKQSVLPFLNPLYDQSYPSYPLEGQLKNYIVARTDSHGRHPVSILLERFYELVEAYERNYTEKKVSCVLLYSWKLPCAHCTDQLIELFSNKNMKVIIVYSTERNVTVLSTLKSQKFKVFEVPYSRFPKRKLCGCCLQ